MTNYYVPDTILNILRILSILQIFTHLNSQNNRKRHANYYHCIQFIEETEAPRI